MLIPEVIDAVVVIIEVKVVLCSVTIEVTRPLELVNTSIIVIILVV